MARRWLQSADVEVSNAGAILVTASGGALKHAVVNVSAAGDNTIIVAVSGKRIRVVKIAIVAREAVDVTFYSGPSSGNKALSGAFPFSANGGMARSSNYLTDVGEAFVLKLSAAKYVGGDIDYYEE